MNSNGGVLSPAVSMQEIGCVGRPCARDAVAGPLRVAGRRLLSTQTNALTSTKLAEYPFEVRVDGVLRERFYDVRDAVTLAKRVKQATRPADVAVIDARTKKLVIKVDG
ncbi:MAG: hypothetical protein U1E25_13475 [Methylocystis sp.]